MVRVLVLPGALEAEAMTPDRWDAMADELCDSLTPHKIAQALRAAHAEGRNEGLEARKACELVVTSLDLLLGSRAFTAMTTARSGRSGIWDGLHELLVVCRTALKTKEAEGHG